MIVGRCLFDVLISDEYNLGATWEIVGFATRENTTAWVLTNVAQDIRLLTTEQLRSDRFRMVCRHGYYFGDNTHEECP